VAVNRATSNCSLRSRTSFPSLQTVFAQLREGPNFALGLAVLVLDRGGRKDKYSPRFLSPYRHRNLCVSLNCEGTRRRKVRTPHSVDGGACAHRWLGVTVGNAIRNTLFGFVYASDPPKYS
jgi:hypothetical protein